MLHIDKLVVKIMLMRNGHATKLSPWSSSNLRRASRILSLTAAVSEMKRGHGNVSVLAQGQHTYSWIVHDNHDICVSGHLV